MLPTLILVVAATASQAQSLGQAPPHVIDLVEVAVPTPRELAKLHALATDVEPHQPQRGAPWVRVLCDDAEQELLAGAGLRLRVVQEDLTSFYAERAAADLPAGALGLGSGVGSMGGFRTLAEIENKLVQLAVTHASVISMPFSIGTTHQGRPVLAFRLSADPSQNDPTKPTVWYDGLHHAREPISGELVLRFAEYLAAQYGADPEVTWLVDTRDFVFLPCVNPDGYEFNRALAPSGGGSWRKNMSQNFDGSLGVDLNRNYDWQWGPSWPGSSSSPGSYDYHGPAAFSEPETIALRDFMAAELPTVAVSLHAYANTWVFPWGYDSLLTSEDAVFRDIAAGAAAPAGWSYGTIWESLYLANGSSLDWMYGAHGCYAFGVEVGSQQDGYWPTPARVDELFAECLEGLLSAARVAGSSVEVRSGAWSEVSGDGDPHMERGESWDLALNLRNEGLATATGFLSLSSSNPALATPSGPLAFQLAPQTVGAAGPLRLDLSGSAPTGQPLELELAVDYDGATQRQTLQLLLGEPHRYLFDDMQLSDFGWQTLGGGAGAWERAAPSATTVQPGVDASGAPGSRCWVTGAKAGPADAGDVDGVQVLTTPVFRASHLAHLRLEYARYVWAPLTGGDGLRVEASDDGGLSWVLLEEVGSAPTWQRPGFDLEQFLTLTESMQLRFTAIDAGPDDTVEVLIDELRLRSVEERPSLGLWGDPAIGQPLRLCFDQPSEPGGSYRLLWSLSSGPGVTTPGVAGQLQLAGTVRTLQVGASDGLGRAVLPTRIPNTPALKGVTVHMQVLAGEGGPLAAYSNLVSFTIH